MSEYEIPIRLGEEYINANPIWPVKWAPEPIRLLGWAFAYSLMSAFNIGFREVNFGRWIRLLSRRDLDIRAKGWSRVISGMQAIVSVYLLAIWLLSFYGTPFK